MSRETKTMDPSDAASMVRLITEIEDAPTLGAKLRALRAWRVSEVTRIVGAAVDEALDTVEGDGADMARCQVAQEMGEAVTLAARLILHPRDVSTPSG